jgi:hypothetical protein
MKKMVCLIITAAVQLLAIGAGAANASPYVLTLNQVGSNVVATGSGEIDLTGLFLFTTTSSNGVFVYPSFDDTITGNGSGIAIYAPTTGTIKGPSSYGNGGYTSANSDSGVDVGLSGLAQQLFVPIGYVSDTALSDSATYNNTTFALLGITPGVYTWTWGTGVNQSFTLEIGQTPIPATLPLFATGLAGLAFCSRRRKRKGQAIAA